MNHLIERMGELQRDCDQITRKKVVRPKSDMDRKPLAADVVYAEMAARAKRREISCRGPYSPLYSTIYPVVCITRVFGLAPYDFTGDRMTTSRIFLIFSFAFLLVYSYIMYIVFLRFISMTRNKPILNVVETTKVCVCARAHATLPTLIFQAAELHANLRSPQTLL